MERIGETCSGKWRLRVGDMDLPSWSAERVVLAAADEQAETRSLVCVHRESGSVLWETIVHQGSPTPPKNKKGTQASSTPACDGERLFINFLHDGAMVTSALSLEGEIRWQTRITDYVVHQGFGSSPAVYGPLVIVVADNKSGRCVGRAESRDRRDRLEE